MAMIEIYYQYVYIYIYISIILYYIILYYIVLYYIILYYIMRLHYKFVTLSHSGFAKLCLANALAQGDSN